MRHGSHTAVLRFDAYIDTGTDVCVRTHVKIPNDLASTCLICATDEHFAQILVRTDFIHAHGSLTPFSP